MAARIARAMSVCAALALTGFGCSSSSKAGCPQATPNACGSGGSAYCASFASDNANCGACGNVCPAEARCSQSTCVGCPGGFSACNALGSVICVDAVHDVNNCGACGNKCAEGQGCASGHCACPAATPDSCTVPADGGASTGAFCTAFS